jgi:hypothetical protein
MGVSALSKYFWQALLSYMSTGMKGQRWLYFAEMKVIKIYPFVSASYLKELLL